MARPRRRGDSNAFLLVNVRFLHPRRPVLIFQEGAAVGKPRPS